MDITELQQVPKKILRFAKASKRFI